MNLRKYIRGGIPNSLREWVRRKRIEKDRKRYASLSRAETFERIYRSNSWGQAAGEEPCSGPGSDPLSCAQYVGFVKKLVSDHKVEIVVDLGCGDYRVGGAIRVPGVRYIGVDIVKEVIERNRISYGCDEVQFLLADIVQDELPKGQLCLVRQVLQHLSNDEIMCVIPKLMGYEFVLISEHQPVVRSGVRYNVDKPHGPDIRIYDASGVFLDKPPFALRNVNVVKHLDIPLANGQEVIRTFLMRRNPDLA